MLKSLQPIGSINSVQKGELTAARERILLAAKQNSDEVRKLLQVYENAYDGLLRGLDPRQFRKFLLDAPGLFVEIGQKMGALSHITSFCRFRFPEASRTNIVVDDLIRVLQDFSKGFGDVKPERTARTPDREASDQLLCSENVEPCLIVVGVPGKGWAAEFTKI